MISIQNISKSFGPTKAVDGLSLEIKDREVVGLLGPNGAGKTTTMRIVSGYLAPDTGKVVVEGSIGYMPENNPLYKNMTVAEVMSFVAELRQMDKKLWKEGVDFAVESVGIAEVYNKPIGELSKGYKQRVGIAAAILHKPKVLILDEPTEGLDPNQRADIRNLIKILGKNQTVVISTHVMQEVEAVCNRVVIINKGKLVADGAPTKLRKQVSGKDKLIVDIEGVGVLKGLKNLYGNGIEVVSNISSRIRARVTNGTQKDLSKEIAKHKWTVWEMSVEKQKLEDVFFELTQ